jgi:hypothetical protein
VDERFDASNPLLAISTETRRLDDEDVIETGAFATNSETISELGLYTKWQWDGSVAPDGKGLPLIVNVRRFENKKEWMNIDTRPSVRLNNLIVK